MEGEDNVIFWHAGLQKGWCDTVLNHVVFNPDLAVANAKIQIDRALALVAVPADVQQQVLVALVVQGAECFDVLVTIGNRCDLRNEPLDDLPILFRLSGARHRSGCSCALSHRVHVTTSSLLMSTTIRA